MTRGVLSGGVERYGERAKIWLIRIHTGALPWSANLKSSCHLCGKKLSGKVGFREFCTNRDCRMYRVFVCSLIHHRVILDYRRGERMRGASGKYDREETPEIVFEMILKYYTDKEICEALEIHHSTYYDWLKSKPELSESVRIAKKIRGQRLVPKLKKRASGYYFTEKTEEPLFDKDGKAVIDPETGKQKISVVKRVRKYQAPDVPALKFFLTNQDPDEWKEKSTTELEIPKESGVVILKEKMSIEEWQKMQQEQQEK